MHITARFSLSFHFQSVTLQHQQPYTYGRFPKYPVCPALVYSLGAYGFLQYALNSRQYCMKKIIVILALFFCTLPMACAQNAIEECHPLKNNYILWVNKHCGDSLLHFSLQHDHTAMSLFYERAITLNDSTLWRKYNSRYEGLDFDWHFGITYFIAEDMLGLELYDKSTAENVFKNKCFMLCGQHAKDKLGYRLAQGLLLCLQINSIDDRGTLYLIDLQNNTMQPINLPQEADALPDMHLQQNTFIKKANAQHVTIVYNNGITKSQTIMVRRTKSDAKEIIIAGKDFEGELKENRVEGIF